MTTGDLYNLLGLSANATPEEIKAAYFAAARRFHPDGNPNPGATEEFKLVADAYSILSDPGAAVPVLARRLLDRRPLASATERYADLVARIHSDGYRVDSYVIPFFVDDDLAGSTLLRRVAGLVRVPVDREIPMLYTSFLPSQGVGILWSYGRGAPAVAVGSTGGGVALAGIDRLPPLTWDELARDLRLARQLTGVIHLFSLEGAVRLGYLSRLIGFDWDVPTAPPSEAAPVERIRAVVRSILWAVAHPLPVVGVLAAAIWLLRRCRPDRI